jgi:hypothetical protein
MHRAKINADDFTVCKPYFAKRITLELAEVNVAPLGIEEAVFAALFIGQIAPAGPQALSDQITLQNTKLFFHFSIGGGLRGP